MEHALCRIEPVKLAKSCTAPKKTAPITIHNNTGSHPNQTAAKIGPTIGPAAAIAEKCCPNKNTFLVGTKSMPS